MMTKPRVERVAVESEDVGPLWEAWCRDHPLPNGRTGLVYDSWFQAMDAANEHASIRHAPAATIETKEDDHG